MATGDSRVCDMAMPSSGPDTGAGGVTLGVVADLLGLAHKCLGFWVAQRYLWWSGGVNVTTVGGTRNSVDEVAIDCGRCCFFGDSHASMMKSTSGLRDKARLVPLRSNPTCRL